DPAEFLKKEEKNMRTLKKSLCLVLALVMVLGLCMIGANAEYANYTDKEEIYYADAVEVLSGLGVVEGRTDGSSERIFDPKATVTRAEACAMIARMMLGPDAANKLPVGDVKFNDVSLESWEGRMARYIAFCANRGIVVGDGNGNFRPNDPVKGTELAAMLLRALGYGAIGEYEGKGWDVNAVADALYFKIFEDSEVTDFSAKATREETALYIWNTMRQKLVGYDVDLNYYTPKPKSFAQDVFGLDWFVGQITENQDTGSKYTVIDGENYEIESTKDKIAHEVRIFYKYDVTYTDKENNDYLKAYLIQDVSTVLDIPTYYGDLYKELKAGNKDNVDLALGKVDMWVNYAYTTDNDITLTVADLKGKYTGSGMIAFTALAGIDFVLGEKGDLIALMTTEYTVDKVTAINDDGITLQKDKYVQNPYNAEYAYDGIKKGDYVTVQPVGDIYYLYETTTEEVDIFEVNSNNAVYGGAYCMFNYYQISAGDGYGAVTVPGATDPATIEAGSKVLLYKDCYGKFFAIELLEAGTSAGIVFVTNKASWSLSEKNAYDETDTTVYVQTVNAEGEEVVYPVVKVNGADAVKNTNYTGVYKVNLNKKGEATLNKLADSTMSKGKGTASISANGSVYYVTEDTAVYYVKYKDESKASTIQITKSNSIKGAGDGDAVYVDAVAHGGGYDIRTAWIIGDAPASTSVGSYIYVAAGMYGPFTGDSGFTDVNEDTIDDPYFTVYFDGVSTSYTYLAVDNVDVFTYYANEGFYTYSYNETDKWYELTRVAGMTATSGVKQITVTLAPGAIHDDTLVILDNANAFADSVSLKDITLKNISSYSENGRYLTINDFEAIDDLFSDGYKVTVTYVAALDPATGNWVPQGVIYLTKVTPPAPPAT
nr:S-layer homology domain-containing protein [Bacteroidales bacterium]